MALDVAYQRVQPQTDLKGSLLFKYRLAKGLTMVSLFAIVLMAASSIFYPNFMYSSDSRGDTASDSTNQPSQNNQNGRCYLPATMKMPTSPDGSYTPPAPHRSLVRAVNFASPEEYQEYCEQYDQEVGGYSDVWKYNENGECGNWQEKYIKLHKENMEVMEKYKNGDFPSDIDVAERPKFISYLCKEVPKDSNRGCGGLADRMGGMISTMFYALLTDRAYLLNWAEMNPLPLEAVLERPHVEWSHDPEEMEALFTDEDNELLGYQKVDTLNKKAKVLKQIIFPDGGEHTEWKDLWNGTYVEVRSNRGYILRTFEVSKKYTKILNDMGLTLENTFRCLTNFLFRPTIGARRFLNAYKQLFAMESVLSIGIQIRTDDNALANPQFDENNLEKWGHFVKCAADLAAFKKRDHHNRIVFFLVTDSAHLRDEFISMNSNRELAAKYLGEDILDISSMVITGLPIEHIEPDQIAKYIDVKEHKEVNLARMTPGVNSAFMENWLLGETQYRVISIQGYGKMAAFYSGDDKTSISMPKPSKVDGVLVNPDISCSTDDSFTTFKWLSNTWSLG
ncbi:hypothetical protein MFLAVUS_007636 [Mucor flavus]|uniref:Uncharacterized protein n=1 Tax=Mucor flavus TaxID=439312 RepID=A0ABP9Z4U9_9FUNG